LPGPGVHFRREGSSLDPVPEFEHDDEDEVVVYPELGMETIFKITVKDFPAFIIVDDKGNDLFEKIPA
jgi:hypothetical protein